MNTNYTIDSKKLLNIIDKYNFSPLINKIKIQKSSFLYKIFKKMNLIYQSLIKTTNFESFQIITNEVSRDKLSSKLSNLSFTSNMIQNDILNTFKFEHKIQFKEIQLNYYSKNKVINKKEKDDILNTIICILLFKNLYNRSYFQQKITYFPSSLTKLLPNSPNKLCLGPHECNSGLTFVATHSDPDKEDNGDIILFRKEEHIKVLIHEMIHANFRDLLLIHNNSKEFTNRFCTDYDILLNESYTEFLATILNIFYISIIKNYEIKKMNEMLNKEIKYGIYVCNKILKFYHIEKIQDILKINDFCKKHLSQKTNVISYYLFKPLQFLHLNQMQDFLNKHTKFLQIKDKESALLYKEMIFGFVKEHSSELLEIHLKNNKKLNMNNLTNNKSLRMTLFELNI